MTFIAKKILRVKLKQMPQKIHKGPIAIEQDPPYEM